ncbi:MAG TPA: hypothetical protein VKG65_01010 [Terriglobales bacterium]|nr:hypothetical protein [Terriglobales bacterium]
MLKNLAPSSNVCDSSGLKPHQAHACCVGSYRIIRRDNFAEGPKSAIQRPIAFHCDNSIRNHEVDWNGGAQIENAFLNALSVENILRPAVSCARNDTEHILHAQRDPRPVMGLDLRHGNQEVAIQHSTRQPKDASSLYRSPATACEPDRRD